MASGVVFMLVVSVLLSFQPLCCSSRPMFDTPDFQMRTVETGFEPGEIREHVDHQVEGITFEALVKRLEVDVECLQNYKSEACKDEIYKTSAAVSIDSRSLQMSRLFTDLPRRRGRRLQNGEAGGEAGPNPPGEAGPNPPPEKDPPGSPTG